MQTERTAAVDQRRGLRLATGRDLGARFERAVPISGDVGAEHVRDAVRLDAAQVVEHQHVGREGRVILGEAHRLEDGVRGVAHLWFGDDDLIGLGDFESLEHGRPPDRAAAA